MNPIFGFAPFILFAVLMVVSADLALWVAFAAAFCIGTYTFLHTRELRMLDAGGTALFGGLALYVGFIRPTLSIAHIRLGVDCGMFAIAIVSLMLRNPFALPHGRQNEAHNPAEFTYAPKTNYIVTGVWTAAFGFMAALDAASSLYGKFPLSLDVALGLGLLGLAVIFTARYPVYVQRLAQNANRTGT